MRVVWVCIVLVLRIFDVKIVNFGCFVTWPFIDFVVFLKILLYWNYLALFRYFKWKTFTNLSFKCCWYYFFYVYTLFVGFTFFLNLRRHFFEFYFYLIYLYETIFFCFIYLFCWYYLIFIIIIFFFLFLFFTEL